MEENSFVIPDELVISKIYLFRDKKVMLDSDLADLYGIETKRLNQAVNRNLDRFPDDFMFQLSDNEFQNLRSQIVTSSSNFNKAAWGGRRNPPYVFTEHGVLMLSSVLNSKKAIAVNIQLMRIFIKMRELLLTHKDILLELESIRKSVTNQDDRIDLIYNYLIQFIKQEEKPRIKIGYMAQV